MSLVTAPSDATVKKYAVTLSSKVPGTPRRRDRAPPVACSEKGTQRETPRR